MAKLTAAEAYKIHAKEERRKAAIERRTTAAGADELRVRKMYAGPVELTPDGRPRTDRAGRNNENKRGPKAS